MFKMKNTNWILFTLGLLLFSSCLNEKGKNNLNKPHAMSKSNDLVVVADKQIWNSEPGDTFKYYFESAYPITPNPEPLFNLRYFSYQELDAQPLRRQLRSYAILANLSDTESPITKMLKEDLGKERIDEILSNERFNIFYGQDKWARDQLVIYIVGKNTQDLISAIEGNFNKITEKVHVHDEPQIIKATYFSGNNGLMVTRAKQSLGINVDIPKDYKQALFNAEEKFIWGRRDTKKAISNFMVKTIEYKDTSQFNEKYIIKLINQVGKYVTSDSKDSKLVVNSKDLPILRFDKVINGNQTIELRGIWEMTDDFMGGAFIAYLIKNKTTNDLAFALAFVYSPGKDKKEYLQQMMTVANTIDFVKK